MFKFPFVYEVFFPFRDWEMKPEILPAIFEVSGSLSSGRAQLIPRDLANWRQPPTLCKCAHRTSLMSVVQAQESRATHNQIQTS